MDEPAEAMHALLAALLASRLDGDDGSDLRLAAAPVRDLRPPAAPAADLDDEDALLAILLASGDGSPAKGRQYDLLVDESVSPLAFLVRPRGVRPC